jgi:hypothetical protein
MNQAIVGKQLIRPGKLEAAERDNPSYSQVFGDEGVQSVRVTNREGTNSGGSMDGVKLSD